jgi:hypothetical protein
LTAPDGSAESFTNDIGWIACNLEYAPAQWAGARDRAESLGIRVMPWIRLCHPNHGEDFETIKQRLSLLMVTAEAWGDKIILPNYEVEAEIYTPDAVADFLYNYADWDGETGWSTLAWLPNSVDFSPISDRKDPALLQIFPKDNNWLYNYDIVNQKMGDCVYHARVDKGFDYVGVTYQTYDHISPLVFNTHSYAHSVFPGNLIGHGQWPLWFR